MSLSFFGPSGSFERRWIVYAMLRDNVQHHLEGGTPSPAFAALHAVSDALAHGETTVSARTLREQVERARPLTEKPIDELAVSLRTRAVCSLHFPLPETRGTSLASRVDWPTSNVTAGAKTLGDLFGDLVSELLRITEGAGESDLVTIRDC